MKVQGYEVPEGILTAIEEWIRFGSVASWQAGELAREIQAIGKAAGDKVLAADGAVSMRLADRLIQKHSKAGNITKRSQQGERARWGWKR